MSQVTKDCYQGPYVNGKREGQGTYYFKSGNIYSGSFKSDLRDGFGRMTFPNQDYMEGTWSEGNLIDGCLVYKNGNYYKGPFINNQFANGGVFVLRDKNLYYTGEFANNQFSGKGQLIWQSTNTFYYNGHFYKDEFYGEGELYVPNSLTVIKGQWQGEKIVKNAEVYENGIKIYEGDLINGLKQGLGKFYQEDAKALGEGIFENNELKKIHIYHIRENEFMKGEFDKDLNGNGELFYADRSCYKGSFYMGLRHGKGRMMYSNKGTGSVVFDGEWFRGNKKRGKMTLTEEAEFEGDFISDDVVKGIYRFKSGEWYDGSLINWKKDGQGTYYYNKDFYIQGYWINDLLEDTAQIFFQDKTILQGTFRENKLYDKGKYKFGPQSECKSATSIYSEGKKCGPGKLKYKNGGILKCFWQDDEMVGDIEYTNKNYYFKGQLKNSMKYGKGEEIYENGDRYIGEFENNLRSGRGKYIFIDKTLYEGEFFNGDFNGHGRLTYPNEDVYEGNFENSLRCGQGTFIPGPKNQKFKGPVKGNWTEKGKKVEVDN